MTLLVFPELPGIGIAQSKRPEIKSQVFVNPLSGRESRLRFQVYPKYTFKISMSVLIEDMEDADFSALISFMAKVGGQSSAFLYKDPSDNRAIKQFIGKGTGAKTEFQLLRVLGGPGGPYAVNEPLHNINPVPDELDPALSSPYIYVDDVMQVLGADYTLSETGGVTFAAAPAVDAVIRATVDYYYRVRLLADGYDFTRLDSDAWECQDIEFIGSVRNVV